MKSILSILSASLVTVTAWSQQPAVRVVRATYGADSRQIDVTAKVASLLARGERIRSDNSFVDNDPAFGTVKTLTVRCEQNGQQVILSAREGSALDLTQPSGTNVSQAITESAPQSGNPPEPRIAPPGIFYLLNRKTIKNDSGIIGINVGTPVHLMSERGNVARVSADELQFDIDRNQLTNDWSKVAPLVAADQSAQGAVRAWGEADKQRMILQRERDTEALAQAEANRAPTPAFGSYSNGPANPLNRGAYSSSSRSSRDSSPTDQESYAGNPLNRSTTSLQEQQDAANNQRKLAAKKAENVAHEDARIAKRLQQQALTAEVDRLQRQNEVMQSHNRTDINLIRELDAKRKLLNSLGGHL